jgi:tetratricopeptide (TPR) repeat protein
MADAGAPPLIRIFVSSPADVMAERERVDRIAQRLNAAFSGTVQIETVRWETHYYTADSTFQRQIADPGACDIVVSIFWQRLGSELPTDFARMRDGRPYPSGTVYELVKALQASTQSPRGLPHVLVYRKTADAAVPMTDRERYRQAHEQREAFLAFWEEWFVSPEGHFKAAYNSFHSTDEFEATFEAHLRSWLKTQGYVAGTSTWSLAENGSPFCSLEPFDASHEEVFFGRARDVDRALERLSRLADAQRGGRFLLLLGESGSGKSSLARAGVVPRILRGALGGEAGAWRAVLMRPGATTDPLLSLAEALFAPSALPELAAGDFSSPAALTAVMGASGAMAATPVVNALNRMREGLRAKLGSDVAPEGGLVVLVDQLEELFAPAVTPERREAFAEALSALAASGQVVVIATLRSDVYADFTRSPGLLALKEAGHTQDVITPGAAEIAQIVEAPAAAAGLTFGVVDAASGERLNDVIVRAASGHDALPLLQFTLSRLFDAMRERLAAAGKSLGSASSEDLVLTPADYDAFGGLEGAIGERAEETFRALDPAAQEQLPRLLRALAAVEQSDGGAAARGALRLFDVRWDVIASNATSAALAQALIDARILVTSQEGGGEGQRRVRLAHEAVLRTWERARAIVAEHREFFRVRAEVMVAERRYVRHRQERGAHEAQALLLPRGVPLAEAEAVRQKFADELDPALVSFIDQSSRRARRRQRLLMAATVLFALTAVGAGAGAFMAMRSEERASRNFDLAIAQADALVSKISEELKDLAVSRDALRRILTSIERQFDAIAKVNPDHPRLLLSRARMLTAFVDNYLDLGETAEALRRSEECVQITRGLVARLSSESQNAAALGACLERLGTAFRDRGRLEESIAAYQESLTIRRGLVAQDADNAVWQRDLADGLRYLGYALVSAGRNEDSLPPLQESVAISRKLAARAKDDPATLRLMADSLNTYAIVLSQLRRPKEALESYEESKELARRLVALDADNATWKRYLSNILANSSVELVALGRPQDALAVLQESLTLRRGLVALDPGNMTWQRELSYILVEVGSLLASLKRNEEALVAYRESIGIVRRLIQIDTGNVAWKNELRRKLPPVVQLLVSLGNRDEALSVLQEGIVLWRESVAANPNDIDQVFELAWLNNYVGNLLYENGRNDEAITAYREALDGMRRYVAAKPAVAEGYKTLATTLGNLARAMQKAGRRGAAMALLRTSADTWRRVVAEFGQAAADVIELVETLRELAALDANPRPLLEEVLRHLQTLRTRGELPEKHATLIGEIEQKLAAAP